VCDILLDFIGFDEKVHRQHALTEVALVELALEDHLVQVLKLGERELLRQKLESHGLVAELGPQSFEAHVQDISMVESQARAIVHTEPGGVPSVGGCLDFVITQLHQCVVGNGDDPFPRVALHGAEGVKLLQEYLAQPGLFLELTPRGLFQGLVDSDEPARQRPLPFEWRQTALNLHHLQLFIIEAEDDAVHGQCASGIFVGMRQRATLFVSDLHYH